MMLIVLQKHPITTNKQPKPVQPFHHLTTGFPAFATDAQLIEYAEQATSDGPKRLSKPHTVCSMIFLKAFETFK